MLTQPVAAFLGVALFMATPALANGDVAIVQGAGAPVAMNAAAIATLPTIQVSVSFATAHGPREAMFEGPLLWVVLDHAHAIDPAKHEPQVRQTILLTGQDGYAAVLALGEIAPEFEGKQVILAERMDGKPLEQPRIVVPGDHRGGRSVRDVVKIAVSAP